MKKITQFLCVASLLGFAHLGQSQFSITGTLPANYNESFDTYGTNSFVPWINNSSVPAWFFAFSTNDVENPNSISVFALDGNTATGIAIFYGASNSTERALGSSSGTFFFSPTNEYYYGAQFVNNTLSTITNVNISYNGEQWTDNANNAQTIQFFTRVDGAIFDGNPANPDWTPQPALDFITPQNMSVGPLDGNANQVPINGSINVIVPPGHSLWIRWVDADDPMDLDHATGIDDVAITFNGINPAPALTGVKIDLKKPKTGKKLVVKTSKGIKKIKGFVISESNAVSKVSYAAFGGTNAPTNLTFIAAATKVPKPNSKLAKKSGVDLIFNSTKDTKPGVGITAGPVTLLIKVEGGTSNSTAEVTFTNTFTEVKIKQ